MRSKDRNSAKMSLATSTSFADVPLEGGRCVVVPFEDLGRRHEVAIWSRFYLSKGIDLFTNRAWVENARRLWAEALVTGGPMTLTAAAQLVAEVPQALRFDEVRDSFIAAFACGDLQDVARTIRGVAKRVRWTEMSATNRVSSERVRLGEPASTDTLPVVASARAAVMSLRRSSHIDA